MAITKWGKRREALKKAEEYLRECCEHLCLKHKVFSKSARQWIVIRKWKEDYAALRLAVYGAAIAASGREVTAGHFAPCSRRDKQEFLSVQTHEMAIDDLMRDRIAQFYTKLGGYEVEGVYKAIIDQVEKPLMEETLAFANGNKLRAARVLGINRNTLLRKMKSYKIGLGVRHS